MIIEMNMDAARYAVERCQGSVPAPEICPDCRKAQSLEAHGYYWRWVSDGRGEPVRIAVRRFFAGSAR